MAIKNGNLCYFDILMEHFFADFGWYFICVFAKISKKLGVMQKPAANKKNNFSVLKFSMARIVKTKGLKLVFQNRINTVDFRKNS
jgi:hypothetical protein